MGIKYEAEFYKINDTICRRYLDIKADNFGSKPDLIIIGLNPGSCNSVVIENEGKEGKVEELLKTDPTINRISKLIGFNNIKYIRLLNLSDIKDPHSESFLHQLSLDKSHSLFSNCNRLKLQELIPTNSEILLACGVNEKSRGLVGMALEALDTMPVKILNKNAPYYHPLLRFKGEKSWFEQSKKAILGNC